MQSKLSEILKVKLLLEGEESVITYRFFENDCVKRFVDEKGFLPKLPKAID